MGAGHIEPGVLRAAAVEWIIAEAEAGGEGVAFCRNEGGERRHCVLQLLHPLPVHEELGKAGVCAGCTVGGRNEGPAEAGSGEAARRTGKG